MYIHHSAIFDDTACNEKKNIANCRVKKEVDVPASVAYACYSDREAIPEWMPFISTVKVCFLSF